MKEHFEDLSWVLLLLVVVGVAFAAGYNVCLSRIAAEAMTGTIHLGGHVYQTFGLR